MTKRIAVLPARGGSKRIPGKNIRNFCGKPIISYALEAAKKSELFDVIHVSTDSLEISNIVEGLGFNIDFMRPDHLADDDTPIMPVLKYVLGEYINRNHDFDEVAILMPCAPMLESMDLVDASLLLAKHAHRKAVLGVAPYPAPVEWAYSRNKEGELTPLQPGQFSIRSQDIEEKFYDAGLFCFLPSSHILRSSGAGDDNNFVGHILPKFKAVDIDNEDDWVLAEAIYRGLKVAGNIE